MEITKDEKEFFLMLHDLESCVFTVDPNRFPDYDSKFIHGEKYWLNPVLDHTLELRLQDRWLSTDEAYWLMTNDKQ